jgi:hypothetical protein
MIGKRIGEQPVRGKIFGSVAVHAQVSACPGVSLGFAFIDGSEPADYRQLDQLAEQRKEIIGFTALANGYIVEEAPGRFLLLLDELYHTHQDQSVLSIEERRSNELSERGTISAKH